MPDDDYEIRRIRERLHKIEGSARIAVGLGRENRERMAALNRRLDDVCAKVDEMVNADQLEERIRQRDEALERKRQETSTAKLAFSHKLALAVVGALGIVAEVKQLMGK